MISKCPQNYSDGNQGGLCCSVHKGQQAGSLFVCLCSYVSVPEAPAFPLKISTGLEVFKFF